MFKEQLLDYQSEKEYLLIRLLYLENFKLSKNEVCRILDISYPTLKKIVERCNSYLDKYLAKEKLNLMMDTHEVLFQTPPQLPFDELTKFFFVEADKYLLLDLLYTNPSLSRYQLAEKLNISSTKLNYLILQCNELIEEFELQIRNGRIHGRVCQYFYFYFLFYWATGTAPISDLKDIKNQPMIEYLEEQFQQKIGIVEQRKLSLWLMLLREKRKLFNQKNLQSLESAPLKNVEETNLYKVLQTFFLRNWKELSAFEAEQISYITYLFFNSFEILEEKNIMLNSIHINNQRHLIMSKILLLLQDDFNLEGGYRVVNNVLYYLLGKLLFFKGNFYFIDKINLAYFYKYHISRLEEETFKKIVDYDFLFQEGIGAESYQYFENILYLLIFSLRKYRKNKMKIGLLLDVSPFLGGTFLSHLESNFHLHSTVQIMKYSPKGTYDLVITNITDYEITNSDHTYLAVSLGSQDEIQKISKFVEQLILNKNV